MDYWYSTEGSANNSYSVTFTVNDGLLANYKTPAAHSVASVAGTDWNTAPYTAEVEVSVLNADITDTTPANVSSQSYEFIDATTAVASVMPTGTTTNSQVMTKEYKLSTEADTAYSTTFPEIIAVGTYVVNYRFTADNHNEYVGTMTIEVTKKEDKVTFAPATADYFYYNTPSDVAFYATTISGNEIESYKYKEQGAADTTFTTTAPEHVGLYVVRATSPESDDYATSYTDHNFTIIQSGTELAVSNNDPVTFGSVYSVTVTPTATAAAPSATQTFGLMTMSDLTLTVPTTNQLALYVGDTQISQPFSATEGNATTLTYDTRNKDLPAGNNNVRIKYYGNDDMANVYADIVVVVNALAISDSDSDSRFEIVYEEDQNFTFTNSAIKPTGYEFFIDDLIVDPTDYASVVYGSNTIAGDEAGSITFNFAGNYSGSYTVYFDIGKVILTAVWTNLSVEYDGTDKSPELVGVYGFTASNVVTLTTESKTSPGSYTLPINIAWNTTIDANYNDNNFTFNGSSVLFTIGKSTVTFTADTDGNVTVSPAGFTDYTVEYVSLKDGTVYTDLSTIPDEEADVFEIIVTVTDESVYTLVGGTNGSVNLGYVYVNQRIRYCYITFGNHDSEVYALGETIVVPSTDANGAAVSSWTYGGKVYKPGETLQCGGYDMTFKADYSQASVSGTVTQAEVGVPYATIEIKLGATVLDTTYTDEDGNYTLNGMAPGTYNIVATYGENVMTTVITITGSGTYPGVDIAIPVGLTNSVVIVNDNTKVVVDGLSVWYDPVANNWSDNTVIEFTSDDGTKITKGEIIEIVAEIEEVYIDETTTFYQSNPTVVSVLENIKDQIKQIFEIDLSKVYKTNSSDSGTSHDIYNTDNLVGFTFDLSADLQGAKNYVVYRVHDYGTGTGAFEVDALTTTPKDGEYIKLSSDGTQLTVYMNKFSTVIITNDDVPTENSFTGISGTSYPNYMAVTYGFSAASEDVVVEDLVVDTTTDSTTTTYPSSSFNPNTGRVEEDVQNGKDIEADLYNPNTGK